MGSVHFNRSHEFRKIKALLNTNNMSKPVLCYWDIRGLAQPIRLLLTYTGTDFEDKMLSCGPAPGFDKSCWFDNKYSLGLDFPNLPYYIDGDIKITQSNAILRYIARKNDLVGKNETEKAMVDMMADNPWTSGMAGFDYATTQATIT